MKTIVSPKPIKINNNLTYANELISLATKVQFVGDMGVAGGGDGKTAVFNFVL